MRATLPRCPSSSSAQPLRRRVSLGAEWPCSPVAGVLGGDVYAQAAVSDQSKGMYVSVACTVSHVGQEDELRDALVAERDKEIEQVISKLEEESHRQHSEIQQHVKYLYL